MSTQLMPPSGDVSVYLLNMILGSGWSSWFGGASGGGGGASSLFGSAAASSSQVATLLSTSGSLIGTLISGLSSMLLLVGAAILVYTYGTGAANAAHTGDHKISPMWAPLRQAFGIAALAPLPTAAGVSVIMSIVSFPVLLGIGLADNVASLGTKFLVTTGGQVAPANPPAIDPSAIKALFIDEVVQTYMINLGWSIDPVETWTNNNDTLTVDYIAKNGTATLPAGTFGKISLTCPTKVSGLCGPGGAAIAGVGAIVKSLAPVAAQIVNATNGYGTTSAPTIQPVGQGALAAAIQVYQTTIQTQLATFNQQQHTDLSSALAKTASAIDAEGWASLPLFYYKISQYNAQANGIAQGLNLSITGYNSTALSTVSYSEMAAAVAMAVDYADAQSLGGAIQQSAASAAAPAPSDSASWLEKMSIFKNIANDFISYLSHGTDPIADLQTASSNAITALETAWGGALVAKSVTAGACVASNVGAKAANGAAGGLGAVVMGVASSAGVGAVCAGSDAASSMFSGVSTVALVMIPVLFIGAFYLPMSPAIVMTMGVLSWISMVVELFIAAALWAFSHILPGGDSLIHEHAKDGYFVLLEVCLRPVLMVIGYFMAIAMIAVSAYFVIAGLSIAFDSMSGGNAFGPASAVAEVLIVVGAMYVAINHSVGLIHRLPQAAMRMVGRASGIDSGDEETSRGVSSVVAARVGGGSQGAKEVTRGGHGMPKKPGGGAPNVPGMPGTPGDDKKKFERPLMPESPGRDEFGR